MSGDGCDTLLDLFQRQGQAAHSLPSSNHDREAEEFLSAQFEPKISVYPRTSHFSAPASLEVPLAARCRSSRRRS